MGNLSTTIDKWICCKRGVRCQVCSILTTLDNLNSNGVCTWCLNTRDTKSPCKVCGKAVTMVNLEFVNGKTEEVNWCSLECRDTLRRQLYREGIRE